MDDIVDRITRWLETSYQPDPPNDALLMIDARREIERLRAEIVSVRAERDCAQIQADHLSQRLINEARRG